MAIPRSLRIQSTAKPKSNRPSSIVSARFFICQEPAAPSEITSTTFEASRPDALGESKPLGQRLDEAADADLVDHLGKLSVADGAEQEMLLRVVLEERDDPAIGRLLAADHDRERALLRSGLPARDRSVEKADAPARRHTRQLLRHPRRGRRVVDEDRSLAHGLEGTLSTGAVSFSVEALHTDPQRDLTQVGIRTATREDDFSVPDGLGGSRADRDPLPGMRREPVLRPGLRPVVDGDVQTRPGEMSRHRRTHHAKT